MLHFWDIVSQKTAGLKNPQNIFAQGLFFDDKTHVLYPPGRVNYECSLPCKPVIAHARPLHTNILEVSNSSLKVVSTFISNTFNAIILKMNRNCDWFKQAEVIFLNTHNFHTFDLYLIEHAFSSYCYPSSNAVCSLITIDGNNHPNQS